MTILKDVCAELLAMFISDIWLTMAVLALVASAAGLMAATEVDPLLAGSLLLIGCLAIVVESVRRAAACTRDKD